MWDQGAETGLSSLVDYTRALVRVASGLSAVAHIAERAGAVKPRQVARDALRRLENGRFLIAVVGEFRRGKSSFINALLGQNVLMSDVLPTTAVVTRVVYGREPGCLLRYRDGREVKIDMADMAGHVTKLTAASEVEAATIAEAVVSFPTLLCQNNVQIADTPGLGDEGAMTDRTMKVLPEADAAILLTSALAPMSGTEQSLLTQLLQTLGSGRVFIVVNMIDQLADDDEITRVLGLVERRATETARRAGIEGTLSVHGVSASRALAAKLARNNAGYATSRLAVVEQELEAYLARDRGVATLSRATGALAGAARELRTAIQMNHSRTAAACRADIALLDDRLAGLAALAIRATAALETLDASGTGFPDSECAQTQVLQAELGRVAGRVATDVMTDDWTTRPPVERETELNRAVHAACLPILGRGLDDLITRTRDWATAWLAPLAAAERALATLSAEPDDAAAVPPASDLVSGLLPGLALARPQVAALNAARISDLVNFPHSLAAPDRGAAYSAYGIEWIIPEGDTCRGGQPIVRLICTNGAFTVTAPVACKIVAVPGHLHATEGLAVTPGTHLATLEPPQSGTPPGTLTDLFAMTARFHLAADPNRPRIAGDATRQLAASALGTMGRLLRGGNEAVRGFDGLRRTLDASSSYVDKQLRAMSLRNVQAAVADELARLRIIETSARLAAETSDTVTAACRHRFGWLLGQVAQTTRELELRRAREAALLERDEISAAEIDAEVVEIAGTATELATMLERPAA